MAQAYECDRCGGLFSAKGYIPDFRISRYSVVSGTIEYDLCDECCKELETFLKTPKGEE